MAKSNKLPEYQVYEFTGILQQRDGSLLPVSSASDARNMDTSDGNLSTAKGYEQLVPIAVPGDERLVKLIVPRGYPGEFYVVTSKHIYYWDSEKWSGESDKEYIYEFENELVFFECDFLQTKINNNECIVLATGESQMLKILLETHTVTLFGTGLYIVDGDVTVASWDEASKTLTLSRTLSPEEWRRAFVDGVYYGESWYGNILADKDWQTGTDKLYFKTVPPIAPVAGDHVWITGGASDASTAYIDTMYNRLFAAGDPAHPSRLYWSAVPGDGRTVEDWLQVDGNQDASGGYVEVGDTDGDKIVSIEAMSNYILINKRYSTWRMYGDRPSTYTVERIDRNGVEMNHASVIAMYDQPFWFCKNGIMYYNGYALSNIEGGISSLRKFLSDELASIEHSRGCFADHRMYFTCRKNDEEDFENAIVTYDVTTQSYMIRDGFRLRDITSEDGIVYVLTEDRLICQFESGDTYNGVHINAYWKTQPTDLGAKYYDKHLRKISMRATGNRMEFLVYGDHHYRHVERLINPDENSYFTEMLNFDFTKMFEFEFRNVNGSQFCIEGGFSAAYEVIGEDRV